jgi:DNA gyrase/topoisomerase IV subunit A
MYRIKKFFSRIYNLYRWLPIIWKDQDWDHHYIFEILKHKLTFMSDTIRKRDNHTLAKYDADRMMLCVKLIDKVQNEEYLMELINYEEDLTKEMVSKATAKHNKAKHILFKILENYIERWWD